MFFGTPCSKTIFFVTTSNTLKYCYKVIFIFPSFLVITVPETILVSPGKGLAKMRIPLLVTESEQDTNQEADLLNSYILELK